MATLSTVNVRITGDTGQLVSSLTVAEKRVTSFSSKVSSMHTKEARGLSNLARAFTNAAGQTGILNSEISILASSMGNVGIATVGAAIGFGVLAGAVGGSINAAINFETAITKVAKTANFSKAETAAFGDEILSMSRRLPVATSALTDVSVVAGQLGINGTANIAAFTEEVAKLSSTTGVEAGTLATQLGQIAQITGIGTSDLGKFSAALTQLGNDFNSTEGQVLDFTTRIAGIGSVVGLNAVQLAAISNAFASVGVEAERGGTAVQRVLIAMQEAAAKGGKELDAFASATGLTTAAFQELAKSNPAEAFTLFVEGLKKSGDQATVVLDDLGLADARLTAAFLSVAAAGSLMRDSLNTATDAAAKGTATNDEFARSSATTAAQIQLLKNNLNAMAVDVGSTLLPAVNQSVIGLTSLVETLGTMAPLLKSLAMALALAGAGFVALKAATAAAGAITAFQASVTGAVAAQRLLTAEVIGAGPVLTAYTQSQRAAALSAAGTAAASNAMMIGFGLVTVGLIAADLAARKFTGGGLIEYMTGAKEKAERAAAATARLAEEMERLTVLQSGLGDRAGRLAFLREQMLQLVGTSQELAAAQGNVRDAFSAGTQKLLALSGVVKGLKEDEDALRASIEELNPSYVELALIVGDNADMQEVLADEIEVSRTAYANAMRTQGEYGAAITDTTSGQRAFQKALRESAGSVITGVTLLQELAAAARENTSAFTATQSALDAFSEGLDIRSLEEIRLDRQIAEADAMIAKYEQLGQTIPEELQRMRDALEANRTVANAVTKAVTLNFEELAAEMVASGAEGAQAARSLGESLRGLPEELQLQIVTQFNRAGADEALEMVARLKELAEHGITIGVAIALMNEQGGIQPSKTLGSKSPELAEGGFVSASKQGELAILHGNELVLPLGDKKRSMELLQQAGMRGFEEGGFTNDAFLQYVMSGQLPPGLTSGVSGGSTGGNGLSELAEVLKAANMSAREFIATLEIFNEQADAAEQMAADAERSKIELTKLAIVLGKEGITGEAFVAQQGLIGLQDAFLKSGMAADAFILHIQGITQTMLGQGKALAKKSGKDVTTYSYGQGSEDIVVDGVRYSGGGNLTEEGLKKVLDSDIPDAVKDAIRDAVDKGTTHTGSKGYPKLHDGLDYVPRDMTANLQRGERVVPAAENTSWQSGGMTFNGPVTVNARGSVDDALRDMALQVR